MNVEDGPYINVERFQMDVARVVEQAIALGLGSLSVTCRDEEVALSRF